MLVPRPDLPPIDRCATLIALGMQRSTPWQQTYELNEIAVQCTLDIACDVVTYFGPFGITPAAVLWHLEAYETFLQPIVTIERYIELVIRGGPCCQGAAN